MIFYFKIIVHYGEQWKAKRKTGKFGIPCNNIEYTHLKRYSSKGMIWIQKNEIILTSLFIGKTYFVYTTVFLYVLIFFFISLYYRLQIQER